MMVLAKEFEGELWIKAADYHKALQVSAEQPAQQEYVIDCPRCGHCCPQRLHTAWQGLTDEEIKAIVLDEGFLSLQHFARAIEAKLKEKNT